jgi:hypothetical protein
MVGMNRIAKRLFDRFARSVADELQLEFGRTLVPNEAVAQKTLMQEYRLLAARGKECLPPLSDVGFRNYSQFEEDGILLYLFSLIPPVNRKCVEICAGNGRECMTANLIINHGWWGYLFDGMDSNVQSAVRFFANNKDTFLHPPKFTKAWITAENVNEHLTAAGITGPVDLLSLDLDGMDYWVWKVITAIDPRVVVCETHNVAPIGRAVTVPYDPKFVFNSENYRGASLEAMCRLGKEKGYRLVGTHRFGFNAFFVKDGLGNDFFPEVSASSCLSDPFSEKRRRDWADVAAMPWHEVK